MKKLLLIGVCLIILSSFASAKDIFGFAPELDMWSEDSVGEESTSAGAGGDCAAIKSYPVGGLYPQPFEGAGSGVLEGASGPAILIGDEASTEG